MALNVEDLPLKVLNILKNEDSSWGVFIRDLRAFLGKPSTNRAMKDSSVEVLVALFYYAPRSIMIIWLGPRGPWSSRTSYRIKLEPQCGTSSLRRGQSTTPSGTSQKGDAGALAKFLVSLPRPLTGAQGARLLFGARLSEVLRLPRVCGLSLTRISTALGVVRGVA